MRKPLLWLPMVAAMIAACGPDNGLGFYATGSLRVTLTDTSVTPAASTTTGFEFAQQTRIDSYSGPDGGIQTVGVCQVGPAGRTVRLTRVGGDAEGLRDVSITMPPWADDSCSSCDHGTIQLAMGNTTFSGTEHRSQQNPECLFTTHTHGSYGMELTIACNGLTALGDARRVAVNAQLTLEECDGPPSMNP